MAHTAAHDAHAPTVTTRTPAAASSAGSSYVVLVAIMVASTFVGGFSQSIMNVTLPHVATTFHVTISIANWLVVGFSIVAATAVACSAALLRRIGLRKLFTLAMGCLVGGSLLAMIPAAFWLLLVARLIQAVSTGLLFPVSTAVIMRVAPRERIGTLLAINSTSIAVGGAISPLVSGFMLTAWGLSAVFVIPAVLAAILLPIGLRKLHAVEARADAVVDLPSVLLAFVGLAFLMYGLSEVTHMLVPSLVCLAIGAAVLAVFAWRQFHIPEPLLSLRPLLHPRFAVGICMVMFAMAVSYAFNVTLPLYFEGALGYTASMAGVLILPAVIFDAVFALASGKIFDKRGIWPLVPVGTACLLVGVAVTFFVAPDRNIPAVIAASAVVYAGVGLLVAPDKSAALSMLPKEMTPHGSSINSVAVQVAGALGSAIFVGMMSADLERETALGVARATAYADAFQHACIVGIVLCCAAVAVGCAYAWKMHKAR